MFRTDLPSIIRSLNIVYTATGICHAGYVDSLLASSGCKSTLSHDRNSTLCEVGQFPSSSEIVRSHSVGFVTKGIAGLWRYTHLLIHCVGWLGTDFGNPV